MENDIVKTIQSRLDLMGTSRAHFAEQIHATPQQFAICLCRKGSLSIDSLNKAFDLIGVDLSIYTKRNDLAKEVATVLLSKGVDTIDNWSKDALIAVTGKNELSLLFDVRSSEEFMAIKDSGIIDIESTFPYFKALVQYHMKLERSNPTASQAKRVLENLTKDKLSRNILAGVAIGALMPISPIIAGAGVVSAAASMLSKQVGAISLFTKAIGTSLFTKALSYFNKE